MDNILGPLAKQGRRDSRASPPRRHSDSSDGYEGLPTGRGARSPQPGLINTLSNTNTLTDSSGHKLSEYDNRKNLPSIITVSRLSQGSYERIDENQDESQSSSIAESDLSGTSSERARKREMRKSNVFLMKVIHGRVPHDLLASRITSTDRENLSTLIPHLASQQNTASGI